VLLEMFDKYTLVKTQQAYEDVMQS